MSLVTVADALDAALTIPNLQHFPGGPPDDKAMPRDEAGQAKPYIATYLGAGLAISARHGGTRRAIDVPLDLRIPFQVTAAAGTYEGTLWAVDKVRAAITGLRLFDNLQTTRIREDPATVGSLPRKDEDVPSDVRWYLPMQYRFTTTT